jgi:tRNA(Ile2) C34 agmatinyltransferase TiaS
MNSLSLLWRQEQIKQCRECNRKLKYMGKDGYICPDCDKRKGKRDAKKD